MTLTAGILKSFCSNLADSQACPRLESAGIHFGTKRSRAYMYLAAPSITQHREGDSEMVSNRVITILDLKVLRAASHVAVRYNLIFVRFTASHFPFKKMKEGKENV